MNTRKLARIALLIALSYLGSMVKIPTPVGTTAFDSAPAFLAGLLLGPWAGATVGLLGHLFTAFLTGFPYSVPIHLTIAVGMAVVVAVMARLSAKRLTLGLIVALLGNGIALPLVLAAWPMFSLSIVISAILPGVLLATALNLIVAVGVYRALAKRYGQSA